MAAKRDEMMARAKAAGYRAAKEGMGVHKNPFLEKTLFWLCWKEGFEERKEEVKNATPQS